MSDTQHLTPQRIVEELDKYIVGQDEAKRNVAIALRNRWRRMQVADDMRSEIVPNNILMIGATGVGKTEIARRLARLAEAPFVKVEASKFTEVGYVGRDVESMVRDLVEQAVNMVKARKKEEVREKAAQLVEDQILDALIPPLRPQQAPTGFGNVSYGGDDMPASDAELNERTRQLFREKLRNGELEDRKIEITLRSGGSPNIGMIGAGMIDEVSMMNLQEMLNNMMPRKPRKKKVTVAEARQILLEEEAARLIDMDEVKEEAIYRAENSGIIFIDEIDKIASGYKKGGGGPDVSREGVQRDLLPIVEGSTVNTKYGVIKTDHILFIAAGAFHISKPSDLIPELQGRFPIRVELNNLTREDFIRILKEPRNALTRQYEALFAAEGVTLSFTDDAIEALADVAFTLNAEVENIGARRLQTVMSRVLNEYLFDVPDKIKPGTVLQVDSAQVKARLSGLIKNKDLSEYIL
ncbi:MAG: ATP-dependent protease ATPase subunit HslU [Cyclobacteriaceae bacterium]|nr:ATP-dependent protease ATPase subunit HslU [Cyclobacteriaceae bacterium]MDW8330507.1 ATP-dependent protease ATPase subunit HslU [Cyclobacteriaceae bacterium]